MAERPDHFKHLRPAPAQPAPEADKPVVHPHIVEHLASVFSVPTLNPAGTMDEAVANVSAAARAFGQQEVIMYLQNLIRGA